MNFFIHSIDFTLNVVFFVDVVSSDWEIQKIQRLYKYIMRISQKGINHLRQKRTTSKSSNPLQQYGKHIISCGANPVTQNDPLDVFTVSMFFSHHLCDASKCRWAPKRAGKALSPVALIPKGDVIIFLMDSIETQIRPIRNYRPST